MEIIISEDKKLSAIRNEFEVEFPHLKIEFFRHEHGEGEASALSDLVSEDTTVGDLYQKTSKGKMNISGDMKVGELEKSFQEQFGIPIQIFHRSGDKWVQSTTTDYWTLTRLNKHGINQTVNS